MKIGYLVPQFPGQTHIFFWREIAALEAAGATVQLYSTRPPPKGLVAHSWSGQAMARTVYLATPSPGAALATAARLPVARWAAGLREGAGLARDLALSLGAAARLAAHARAQGIGHVHVHSCGRAALIAALAHDAFGLSYSLTLHGPLSDYGPGQRLKWSQAAFGTVITRRLDAELRAALEDALPPRVVVQPMGVQAERFARTTPYAAWGGVGPLRLFCCARLNIVKGHQDLIAAVGLLRAQGIDARLVIAGQDDDGGAGFAGVLAERIAAAGLEGVVTLLGAVPEERVIAELHRAHIFALASWHEPLGVAYMEAMAAGVPTVGTDAGGVPELIENGRSGLLVPPRNPQALAEAIARIARDKALALRLAAAGRARVEHRFSSERGAQRLIAEIARLPAGG